MLTLEDIELLFARHGSAQYSGEPVTQLEHALQTAYLAEQSEASDELVTACLLHDLGHLLNEQGETPTLRGIDDTHQYFALPFLRGLFPDAVLDAIKLHVDAKRYLCRANDGYWAKLSDDSKRSLELQGGVFDPSAGRRLPAPAGRARRGDAAPVGRPRQAGRLADAVARPLHGPRGPLRRSAPWRDLDDRRRGAVRGAAPRLVERADQVGPGQGARHRADPHPRLRRRRRPGGAVRAAAARGLALARGLDDDPHRLLHHPGRRLSARRARLLLSDHARHGAAARRDAERPADRRASVARRLARRRRHQRRRAPDRPDPLPRPRRLAPPRPRLRPRQRRHHRRLHPGRRPRRARLGQRAAVRRPALHARRPALLRDHHVAAPRRPRRLGRLHEAALAGRPRSARAPRSAPTRSPSGR